VPDLGPADRSGLSASEVTVRYGGLVAADSVTLNAPIGKITGLIGPNGAGKSTTFNACSGVVKPTAGTVTLKGEDITGLSVQARGQRGLGRTFQRMELFGALTVRDNVGLGIEAGMAASKPWAHMFAKPSDMERTRLAVDEALERCGLTYLADAVAADLSTGQGRLVELARVIAGGFDMLLLDEPSSGLDRSETARFGEILRELVADGTRGILIVEHDMSLVVTVCDYIYVLDFGKLVYQGTPRAVLASEQVQKAYLGSSELEETG
jgi:ABC-type branched-subunit amino acid transport system ATPase component